MRKQFAVTFERWDEAAIEAGDTDDRGYVIENVSLSDAMRLGLEYTRPGWSGPCEPSDSRLEHARWLEFQAWNNGTREWFETGVQEDRFLHIPDSVTPSSRRRIARLFGCDHSY
jgi:hypothetical protein